MNRARIADRWRPLRQVAAQWLAAAALLLSAIAAHAHSASTSYLTVEPGSAAEPDASTLTWRLPLRDADALLDLDADADGRLTWGEVIDREADLVALARDALRLHDGGRTDGRATEGTTAAGRACTPYVSAPRLVTAATGNQLAFTLRTVCGAQAGLTLRYLLFDGIDPSHRLLALPAGSGTPVSLAPGASVQLTAAGASGASTAESSGFNALFADGVAHILGGADHLLFLVALLLPAVLRRDGAHWVARDDLRDALLQVAWLATAFTVAHSITLALASFGLVRVPAAVIEPLIAATVLAAALNNLWPIVTRRLAWVAFGFGLVHGFGFAEVLAPLELAPAALARALLAFNLGVEAGQIAVVVVAFSALALARRWHGYRRWVLGAGSAALAVLACAWIIERVFDLALLPA